MKQNNQLNLLVQEEVVKSFREYTPDNIKELPENSIFVFGSNTEGRHGKGGALVARTLFGAIYGQAKGLQGKSYGIITKDLTKPDRKYPLRLIYNQLLRLMFIAEQNPNTKYYITRIGSSLAGFTVVEIKDLFNKMVEDIPDNIILPKDYEVRWTE